MLRHVNLGLIVHAVVVVQCYLLLVAVVLRAFLD